MNTVSFCESLKSLKIDDNISSQEVEVDFVKEFIAKFYQSSIYLFLAIKIFSNVYFYLKNN